MGFTERIRQILHLRTHPVGDTYSLCFLYIKAGSSQHSLAHGWREQILRTHLSRPRKMHQSQGEISSHTLRGPWSLHLCPWDNGWQWGDREPGCPHGQRGRESCIWGVFGFDFSVLLIQQGAVTDSKSLLQ